MSLQRPIVVGYDGSEGGRDALVLARRLAEALDRPVEVLSVLTDAPVSGTEEGRLVREARKALDGLEVETRVISSRSPARELHDLCEAHEASALVIGARRHDWRGHHRFDGLGGRMLSAGPCPVAIAPTGYCLRAPFENVVLAHDGSAEADLALQLAQRVTAGSGAPLRRIAADDPEDPATAIIGAAGVNDLIVLGSRGYGPPGRVLLGSTAHEVVERAPCAVLITPRRAAVPDEEAEHGRPAQVAGVEPPASRAI